MPVKNSAKAKTNSSKSSTNAKTKWWLNSKKKKNNLAQLSYSENPLLGKGFCFCTNNVWREIIISFLLRPSSSASERSANTILRRMIFQNRSELRGQVARSYTAGITRARHVQGGRFWKIVSVKQSAAKIVSSAAGA